MKMSSSSLEVFWPGSAQRLMEVMCKMYMILLIVAVKYPIPALIIDESTLPTDYNLTDFEEDNEGLLSNLSWVEESDANGPINQDIFFDRVVFIAIGNNKPITTGVFFTERHVLTSFNPYRQKYRSPLENVRILFLSGRILKAAEEKNLLQINTTDVVCARQVIPIIDDWLSDKQWHGTNKTHSPLHDLLVLRIDEEIKFLDPDPSKYSFDNYSISVDGNDTKYTPAGPMVTRLAEPRDKLTRSVKFASLGFRSKEHIRMNTELRSREYEEEESVLDECDEWFPKTWGHFICISNIDNYKGLGSGALLVHNETVFGIGSFVLRKGAKSILVFTDVRPYNHLLFHICGHYTPPLELTTTTESDYQIESTTENNSGQYIPKEDI